METVAEIKNSLNKHVLSLGQWGWLGVGENDTFLNDSNRALIDAFKREHGAAFVGKININNDQRRAAIANGTESPYTEYAGQLVYNFGCDFVVPVEDRKLEEMLRAYCKDGAYNAETIIDRIEQIGGEYLIWS